MNLLRLLERREKINSWETEYEKIKKEIDTKTTFEIVLNDNTNVKVKKVKLRKKTIIVTGEYFNTNIQQSIEEYNPLQE
jgi:hypothetical protein